MMGSNPCRPPDHGTGRSSSLGLKGDLPTPPPPVPKGKNKVLKGRFAPTTLDRVVWTVSSGAQYTLTTPYRGIQTLWPLDMAPRVCGVSD